MSVCLCVHRDVWAEEEREMGGPSSSSPPPTLLSSLFVGKRRRHTHPALSLLSKAFLFPTTAAIAAFAAAAAAASPSSFQWTWQTELLFSSALIPHLLLFAARSSLSHYVKKKSKP